MFDLSPVADFMQENLLTEPVVLYRHQPATADDPIPEPETDPDYSEIPFTCGVNEMKQSAEIKSWGESIGADYTGIVTVKEFRNATGLDATDPAVLDSLSSDRILIRGVVCTVLKGKLTGWNGDTFTWLTIGAKRIER